jgi:3-hydroxybutyryl-CoA dehydrogenase
MTIHTVGVVGAGAMGSGIAQAFAEAGFAVVLHDVSPAALARARQTIADSLRRFVLRGTRTESDAAETLARVTTVASLDDLSQADFVVEAVAEDLAIKCAVFSRLDSLLRPETIFASNTSALSISALGEATQRPDRVLGLHFMNPVQIMALVELVRGRDTSDASMAVARQACARLKKTVVESADSPGFITNRVLMPMINEAIYALAEGVASPTAIDDAMKLGMNHPMGPLALADFIGLDVCLAILNVLKDGLHDAKYTPCPLLVQMVADGRLGRKSGRGFFVYAPGT